MALAPEQLDELAAYYDGMRSWNPRLVAARSIAPLGRQYAWMKLDQDYDRADEEISLAAGDPSSSG